MAYSNSTWDKGSNSLFGDDYNERFGWGGRKEEFTKTGGLSGLKDVQHDFKRWFGGDKSGASNEAAEGFAQLTRQQWADYQRDIIPYENKLIEFSNSTTAVADSMSRAATGVAGAFDRQQGATERRLMGLGLTLNADEQQAMTRSTGLARSLADVQAQNNAATVTRGLQQSLLGNPVPTVASMK